MHHHKQLIRLSYLYATLSVVIVPGIYLLGQVLFPKSLACGDISTGDPKSVVTPFRSDAYFEVSAALIMIAIGIMLLVLLRKHKTAIPERPLLIARTLIALMLTGYGLIILLVTTLSWCATSVKLY